MKKRLVIKPTDMHEAVMKDLEKKGLIIRLCPHNHDLEPEVNEALDEAIYIGKESTGPHKLITVTINRTSFSKFGIHQDNEEFLLIGDQNTKPMYLAIAYLDNASLNRKIKEETLCESDIIILKCRYNDPNASFFVMKAGVPHGEAIIDKDLPLPSFYVTEGRDTMTQITDWGNYQLVIDD